MVIGFSAAASPDAHSQASSLTAKRSSRMEQLSLFSSPILTTEPKPLSEPTNVTLTSISVVAKTLDIGANSFFALLRNDRILDRGNLPIQRYIDAGYFKVVKKEFGWPGSCQKSYNFTTKATGKGVDWLVERYRGRAI